MDGVEATKMIKKKIEMGIFLPVFVIINTAFKDLSEMKKLQ